MFAVPVKDKTAESVIQAYSSGILAYKGGSVTILTDNGTEFKNKVRRNILGNQGGPLGIG